MMKNYTKLNLNNTNKKITKNKIQFCVLLFLFSCLLNNLNAQQAIRHRQSDTVMKYLALANGTNPSVITGINNINHGQSSDSSVALIRTPGGTFLSVPQIISNVPTTIPNETIGAITLTFNNAVQHTRQTSGEIELTFVQKDARVNTNGDNFPDGHFTIWTLPTVQTNGSAIPDGTRVRLTTPTLTNLADGSNIIGSRDDWFQWNLTTSYWDDITFNPNGSPENNNWIDWVQFLSIGEVEFSDLKIYPNPVKDIFNINLPNYDNTLEIELISLSGQILFKNNSHNSLEHSINLSSFNSGVYILSIETVNGLKATRKIIKE